MRASARGQSSAIDDRDAETLEAADILKVLELLPHRYPFLIVDRIIEIDGDNSLHRHQERHLQRAAIHGPFPDQPGLPGRAADRGHGADGRRASACRQHRHRAGAEAGLLHDDRQGQVPQARRSGRPVEYHMRKINAGATCGGTAARRRSTGTRRRGGSRRHAGDRVSMAASIHPTAIVEDGARIGGRRSRSGRSASSAPTSSSATAANCVSHVVVAGDTRDRRAHADFPVRLASGMPPQDLKYQGRADDARRSARNASSARA